MSELGVEACDVVIFGDGSGSGSDKPNGWAACLIDTITGERTAYYGGTSHGSVNVAELMPYIQALTHFHNVGRGQQLLENRGFVRCVIITDSSYVATSGAVAADLTQQLPLANRALFAAVRQLCSDGYILSFHHQGRSQTALNKWADLVSSQTRRAVIKGIEDNIQNVKETIVDTIPLESINP